MSSALGQRGWEVDTIDIHAKFNPTIQADVVSWVGSRMAAFFKSKGRVPDVIVAGVTCTTRSKEDWASHREVGTGTGKPTSQAARHADLVEVPAVWKLIQHCLMENPNLVYLLENPTTCALRQVPCLQMHLQQCDFHDINHGDYGWPLLKPTTLVTNLRCWEPREKTETKSRQEWSTVRPSIRMKWPPALCEELAGAICAHMS